MCIITDFWNKQATLNPQQLPSWALPETMSKRSALQKDRGRDKSNNKQMLLQPQTSPDYASACVSFVWRCLFRNNGRHGGHPVDTCWVVQTLHSTGNTSPQAHADGITRGQDRSPPMTGKGRLPRHAALSQWDREPEPHRAGSVPRLH